jgi:endonuclease-8
MPEGHTIRRMATDHARWFAGGSVHVASPQGRFTAGAALVDGQVLLGTDAHGKHLFHSYGSDLFVHVHLGLYGKFTAGQGEAPAPRGELRMRLVGTADADEPRWLDLRGPSVCEVIDGDAKEAIHARLGCDPLRGSDGSQAWAKVSRSRQPIGALLMDQGVVAGVGNVYRAEVLFRQQVSPFTPGRELSHETWNRIWRDLVGLMKAGVRADRIVTTNAGDRRRRSGRATREDAHYVYRRQGDGCRSCQDAVLTQVFYGRNLFWCPRCQVA